MWTAIEPELGTWAGVWEIKSQEYITQDTRGLAGAGGVKEIEVLCAHEGVEDFTLSYVRPWMLGSGLNKNELRYEPNNAGADQTLYMSIKVPA